MKIVVSFQRQTYTSSKLSLLSQNALEIDVLYAPVLVFLCLIQYTLNSPPSQHNTNDKQPYTRCHSKQTEIKHRLKLTQTVYYWTE